MKVTAQGHFINYQLRLKGVQQTDIADELGVNRSWISRVIHGDGISKRVRDAVIGRLGFNPWDVDLSAPTNDHPTGTGQ